MTGDVSTGRYDACCPTCRMQTTIEFDPHASASHPVCISCGTLLRLSTARMQNTPLAEVWIVPQDLPAGRAPAMEELIHGLTPAQQTTFEALMHRACIAEEELSGYADL